MAEVKEKKSPKVKKLKRIDINFDEMFIRYDSLELLGAYSTDLAPEDSDEVDVVRMLVFNVGNELIIHISEPAFLRYQEFIFDRKQTYTEMYKGYCGSDSACLMKENCDRCDDEKIYIGCDEDNGYKILPSFVVYSFDDEVQMEHG